MAERLETLGKQILVESARDVLWYQAMNLTLKPPGQPLSYAIHVLREAWGLGLCAGRTNEERARDVLERYD